MDYSPQIENTHPNEMSRRPPSSQDHHRTEGARRHSRSRQNQIDRSYFLLPRRFSADGPAISPFSDEANGELRNHSTPGPSRPDHTLVSDWTVSRTSLQIPQAPVVRQLADPPRPAREGLEWVWFPEGYWAERPLLVTLPAVRPMARPAPLTQPVPPVFRWRSRRSKSQRRSRDRDVVDSTYDDVPDGSPGSNSSWKQSFPSFSIARKHSGTTSTTDQTSVRSIPAVRRITRGLSYLSPTYPHWTSPDGDPEGLYCKTKRNIKYVAGSMREHREDVCCCILKQTHTDICRSPTQRLGCQEQAFRARE